MFIATVFQELWQADTEVSAKMRFPVTPESSTVR